MISVRLDPTGPYQVRWPETTGEVIQLARKYTTQQSGLTVTEQVKDVPLATVQALLAQVEAALANATSGETGRATAAEILRLKKVYLNNMVSLMILRLKGRYAENLAQLEGWGLSTKVSARGISVSKPTTLAGIVAFLRAYVAKEGSLIEGQRITDPSLTAVEAMLAELEDAVDNRITGRNQREFAYEQGSDAKSELFRWMQLAGIVLVMKNGGTVSTSLQQYGFTVVERTANRTNGTQEESGGETEGNS